MVSRADRSRRIRGAPGRAGAGAPVLGAGVHDVVAPADHRHVAPGVAPGHALRAAARRSRAPRRAGWAGAAPAVGRPRARS
jgi:hypothetical protein